MATACVLSGGGSLGAVQVGMLLALSDAGIYPDLLVGTSVGAINAAYLATHPGPRGVGALADVWRGVRARDIFPIRPAGAMRATAGRGNHVADPRGLRRLLEENLPDVDLQDAPWPVAVVATDVLTGREVVLERGRMVDAVMASAALPGVFPPVQVGAHLLMDGGITNNAPISVAHRLGADTIYVLPTGYACALTTPPATVPGMLLHAVGLAIQRRLIEEVEELRDTLQLRVLPPLCPLSVGPTNFRHTDELIQRARASARMWLDSAQWADPASVLSLHVHRRQSDELAEPREEVGLRSR